MSFVLQFLRDSFSAQPDQEVPAVGPPDRGSNAANGEALASTTAVVFSGGGGYQWTLLPDGSWACTGSPDGRGVGNQYAPGDPVHDVVSQQYRDATGQALPAQAGTGGGGSSQDAAEQALQDEATEAGGWGQWWEDVGDTVEEVVEDVREVLGGIADTIREGLDDWGILPGVGESQDGRGEETGEGTDTGGDVDVTEDEHYAVVTDANALLREGPPGFASLGTNLAVDQKVTVEEMAYKDGQYRGYARVSDHESGQALGWTSESNLTSCRDINEDWMPEEALDLADLSGDELRLAELYNEKGGFLDSESARLGITAGQAAATMIVESGGRGYSADGRMIIRFENHRFYTDWGQQNPEVYARHFKYNTTQDDNGDGRADVWLGHEWREAEDDEWQDVHQNQGMEYQVLEFASQLGSGAEEAAAGAISMGAGQTMGRDWHEAFGYDSALAMMRDMQDNPDKNVGGIFSFIENNAVAKQALVDEDYVAFATQYNGSGKAAQYGADIEALVGAWDSLMEKKKPASPPAE